MPHVGGASETRRRRCGSGHSFLVGSPAPPSMWQNDGKLLSGLWLAGPGPGSLINAR